MSNDLADFNPFDSATLQCPFGHYAQMRDEQPVMLIESLGMYLVTRHDLVLGILRDPSTYSSTVNKIAIRRSVNAGNAECCQKCPRLYSCGFVSR